MRRSGAKHEIPLAVRAHFRAVLARGKKVLARVVYPLGASCILLAIFMATAGPDSIPVALTGMICLALLIVWVGLFVYYCVRLIWIGFTDYLRWKRGDPPPGAQETDQQVEPPVRDQPPDELGSLRARRRAGARYLVTGGAVWVTLLGMQGSRHGLDVAFDLLLVLAIASVTLVIVVIVRVHRRIRALEEHQTPSLPTIPTEKPRHSTDQ